MKKLLTLLMAVALVFVPVKAFADEEDLTVGYEIVDEDYYDEDEDEFYDDYEDDDYDYENEYYDEEEYDYYDDDIASFDEGVVAVDKVEQEKDDNVSLSVCSVVLLATVPFIAGLLVGAGVMILSCKAVKKETKKEEKKNDK